MSFLTLVLIAIERYLAIRLHLSYATTITTKRILKIVTFIWVVVTVLTSIRSWDINEVFFRPPLITAASLSTGILVVCYSKIFILVRRHRQQILNQVSVSIKTRENKVCISVRGTSSQNSAEKLTMTRQKKSTLTMVYILLFFFLCYLPSIVYQVVVVTSGIHGDDESLRVAYRYTFTLISVNSSLNPVLYCLRITELREAVINVVKKTVKRK